MSKIIVTQEKFDEAGRLYGYNMAREFLVALGNCPHFWQPALMSGKSAIGQDSYAFAFLKCDDCGETKDHLNLLG